MEVKYICEVCGEFGRSHCSRCNIARYCSKEHQVADWPRHQPNCVPIILKTNTDLGTHTVATKDIKSGQVIYKEKYIISTPFEEENQYGSPLCLTCSKEMVPKMRCTKCYWILCSDACMKHESHAALCKFTLDDGPRKFEQLKRKKSNHITNVDLYEYLFAIRCFYDRENKSEIWNKIKDMKVNISARSENEVKLDIGRYSNMGTVFQLGKYTIEDVITAVGILRSNKQYVGHTKKIAIYGRTSAISHSCLPNAFKQFHKNEKIVLKACRDISEGDVVNMSYVVVIDGHFKRRKNLLEWFNVNCSCPRCTDPTDMGTHLNSLRCTRCKVGNVLPPIVEGSTEWVCERCKRSLPIQYVTNILEKVNKMLNRFTASKTCDNFLNYSQDIVHENHYSRLYAKIHKILISWIEDEMSGELYSPDSRVKKNLEISRNLINTYAPINLGCHSSLGPVRRRMMKSLAWNYQNRKGYGDHDEEIKQDLKEMWEIANQIHTMYLADSIDEEEENAVIEAKSYAKMAKDCLRRIEDAESDKSE